MPADERVFWRSDTSSVRVGYDDRGRLVFTGVDRKYLDGYEYSIIVAPDRFEKLRKALGADPGADVVDLVWDHVDAIMGVANAPGWTTEESNEPSAPTSLEPHAPAPRTLCRGVAVGTGAGVLARRTARRAVAL